MAANYDYLTFTLERGRQSWSAFVSHMRDVAVPAMTAANGEILGVFQGQLGFASNEAIVLLRSTAPLRARLRELDAAPSVVTMHPELLTPTVRPSDTAVLKRGGIYVHRWFSVDVESVADFITLSNRAWERFEGSYETEIFGLFTAERTTRDVQDGTSRLLLLTYYASHGVWEQSRDQTRDAGGLFVQRHGLTRSTIGRSSILV